MLVSTAVGGGVVVPLYRTCGYVKVTNADATNPVYVSLRNTNDGNAIANQTTSPNPSTRYSSDLSTPSAFLKLYLRYSALVGTLKVYFVGIILYFLSFFK